MNGGRWRAALLTVLALVWAGCGGDGTPPAERPEFTRPDLATRGSADGFIASTFTDVTEAAGIDFEHVTGAFGQKWMPETVGSGGGFLDYDQDGWPDLFLVNSREWPGHESGAEPATSRLYRNRGDGTFEDVTALTGTGLTIYGMGATFGDYDGDGDPDIYVTAVGDNKLLRNDGGRFTDVTRSMGVDGNPPGSDAMPAWSTAAAWVDVDRDGFLDLFVCNYVRWTPETDIFTTRDGTTKSYATPQQYHGESCRLYGNQGGTGFRDTTEDAGLLNPEGKSLGIAVEDFNDDGWPDLFVANDTYQNFLYLSNGDGTFRDAAVSAGVAFDEMGRARAGMGVDVVDVAAQGRLSIAIGNFSNEPVSLYTQMGGELFQDLAGAARLTRGTLLPLTFGLRFADFDLDGYPDLLTANGHIEPEINAVQADVTFRQRPQLFRNTRRGQFEEVTDAAGDPFQEAIVGRGLATADIDRDGDLDVLITTNGGRPLLLRNDLPSEAAHWVRLRLRGQAPNRDAIGAVVTVFAGDLRQRRSVRSSSSYLSQSEGNPLLFGLGARVLVDSVHVRWPTTGALQRVGPLAADTAHVVTEERSTGN